MKLIMAGLFQLSIICNRIVNNLKGTQKQLSVDQGEISLEDC